MDSSKIYVFAPGRGVCVGGRFDGWEMRRHPDGQWVSVRKLEARDPWQDMPASMRALFPATKEKADGY